MSDLIDLKLFIFDVDGVLTDGSLYYGPEGEQVKCFNVKDGVAFKLWPELGAQVAVISAKQSPMLVKRLTDLRVVHQALGCADKVSAADLIRQQLGLQWQQVAFVGDDCIDLPLLRLVGASVCPSDAHEYVRSQVDMVMPVAGGKGVARLLLDLWLKALGKYPQAYERATQASFEPAQP